MGRQRTEPAPLKHEPTAERIMLSPAAGRALFEMDDLDRSILQLKMRAPHLSNVKIGEALGIHPVAIGRRLKRPGFVEAYRELSLTFADVLEKAAEEGVRTLRAIMKDTKQPASVRVRAAEVALQMKAGMLKCADPSQGVGNTTRIYRTTITPQGALIQEVMESELGPRGVQPQQEMIDVSASTEALSSEAI